VPTFSKLTLEVRTLLELKTILWEMVGDYQNGNNSAKPIGLRVFNSVVAVWSKTEALKRQSEAGVDHSSSVHELYNAEITAFKPNCTYSHVEKLVSSIVA
jgi:hypothetical protein